MKARTIEETLTPALFPVAALRQLARWEMDDLTLGDLSVGKDSFEGINSDSSEPREEVTN